MLSVDDVALTPEVDYISVTPSCRRSSLSCDGDEGGSATLRRWGSLRGSVSSVGLRVPQWRRESFVEALEKKCRENVSNRLRSQLPRYLHNSATNACTDLPVIVRAATATLPRPSTPASSYQIRGLTQGITETSRQPSGQLYQGIRPGSSLQLGRRHSTAGASRPPDHWTRSLPLSRQSRRGSGQLTQQTATTSASSTLERSSSSSTGSDSDWSAGKRATLPIRLQRQRDESTTLLQSSDDLSDQSEHFPPASSSTRNDRDWAAQKRSILTAGLSPSYDSQRVSDVGVELLASGYYTGSTSSTETDGTADCDVNPDSSDDTDSYGEVSVSSFTFSPSRTQAREPSTSSAVGTDCGTDAGSKEMTVDDSSHLESTPSRDIDLLTTNESSVALKDKMLTSGPSVGSNVTDRNVGSSRTREIARPSETDDIQSSTTHATPANHTSCWNDGQYKTADVNHLFSMSGKNTPAENAKSGIAFKASGEGTSCDGPRYRTSVTLSLCQPSLSTTDTELPCHSTSQRPRQSSVEISQSSDSDSSDLSSPPPLPLSAQPDTADLYRSYSSEDELSEEQDQLSGHVATPQSPTYKRTSSRGDDDGMTVEDERRTDEQEHTAAATVAAAANLDDVNIDTVSDAVTQTTAATGTSKVK